MMRSYGRILCITLLSAIIPVASADYQSDLEDWFNSDDDKDFENILAINEGQLNFLIKPPDQPVHHHQNKLIISNTSLDDGWISLQQCHYNMDNFPRVEVVYSPERIRKLEIVSSKNIELAWVENGSVQLVNVAKGASLCVKAESRALSQNIDGSYTLKNGPFMRKFLDGYFPMHVSIDIKLPKQLEFASVSPAQQAGFAVSNQADAIHLDAWFEGRLKTVLQLKQRKLN
ncbi:MAG TPA: hypothetical protein ENI64_05430 [Gammaproteobacteria bacterium]|nr:hypothetical protein [Gammaproteobacteria bacterium]